MALQREGDQVYGALYIQEASIDRELVEIHVVSAVVTLSPEIAIALAVFVVNACLRGFRVQALTAHHIGDPQLEWGHHPHA